MSFCSRDETFFRWSLIFSFCCCLWCIILPLFLLQLQTQTQFICIRKACLSEFPVTQEKVSDNRVEDALSIESWDRKRGSNNKKSTKDCVEGIVCLKNCFRDSQNRVTGVKELSRLSLPYDFENLQTKRHHKWHWIQKFLFYNNTSFRTDKARSSSFKLANREVVLSIEQMSSRKCHRESCQSRFCHRLTVDSFIHVHSMFNVCSPLCVYISRLIPWQKLLYSSAEACHELNCISNRTGNSVFLSFSHVGNA